MVAIGLAVLAPWPFASIEPVWQLVLTAGVALLAALWAVHILLTRRLTVRPDLPSACLAGLVLLSAVQLVPLPEWLVGVLSPTATAWHREFRPAVGELLPGETAAVPRPSWLPLSVDPHLTRTFLAQSAAVLLLYLAVRNWLASKESFRRLAWAAAANGAALALLALTQFVSSPRNMVFWQVETDGAVFGPFVCRNNYPDYVAFCAGLAAGLIVFGGRERRRRAAARWVDLPGIVLESPQRFAVAAGLALMLTSIPFSLSRAGGAAVAVSAVVVAAVTVRGRVPPGLMLVGAAAVGLAGWFGWGVVEERFASVWTGRALDDRWPFWKDEARLVPQFPLVGTGNGTFVRVEPLVRTQGGAGVENPSAHNEYLEAVIEGGVVRLALTLGLVGGLLAVGWRAAARLRGRSVGALVIGGLFGLTALAIHSLGDFGPHIPAVTVIAIVVAGHVVAAGDRSYLGTPHTGPESGGGEPPPLPPSPRRTDLAGGRAVAAAALLLAAGPLLVGDARVRAAADRLRRAVVIRNDRPDEQLRLAAAWAALTPADADAHLAVAQAHFDAALEDARAAARAVAGGSAGRAFPPEAMSAAGPRVAAGLAAARAARDTCPLFPQPHARLGRYAAGFTATEPTRVHLDRAKRLLPIDPDLWFACGSAALAAGDRSAALADWAEAMRLSPRLVGPVLTATRRAGISTDRLLDSLVVSDPVAVLTAADALYPDRVKDREVRQTFLRKATAAAEGRPNLSARDWIAVAAAYDELGAPERAEAALKEAVEREPDTVMVRDVYARWLEANERYEDAVPVLKWLLDRQDASTPSYRVRLATAQHAIELKRVIESQ